MGRDVLGTVSMHTNGSRNSLSGPHHAAAGLPAGTGGNGQLPRLPGVVRDDHNGKGNNHDLGHGNGRDHRDGHPNSNRQHNGDGHHNARGNGHGHDNGLGNHNRHNVQAAVGLPRLPGPDATGRAPRAADGSHPCPADSRPQDDPRVEALRRVADQMKNLPWTPALFALLLDELYADDLFTELVGDPDAIPPRRYAHAVAVAIALRHSWRPDDLKAVIGRMGVVQVRRDQSESPRGRRRHGADT